MMQDGVWKVTLVLSLVWTVSLLYGEMFAFWVPYLWSCSWPHPPLSSTSEMNREAFVKVAVLADPQLMDRTSHGFAPKSLALQIVQFYTDLFMRRSFFASILPFKPNVILFLGDHFDGGNLLSDEEWKESLSRFKHIFDWDHGGRYSNAKVYYLSGNHDIGYEAFHSHKPQVLSRYESEFGPRNYRFTVGAVEFVAVDAQTLDGSLQGGQASASWNFIKNLSTDISINSRVLLSHIPLYRPDWTPCGPYRYSPVINQRVSRSVHDQQIMYQNYLSEETSSHLLDLIKPILVLSGHDHDQCTVTHISKNGPVREHTVGTVSWQQGNLYPSFMLLSTSIHASSNTTSTEDIVSASLCFLPIQTYIYLWYLLLLILTILVLFLWPKSGLGLLRHCSSLVVFIRRMSISNLFVAGIKEKNEDDNCEYEMVWDAEGSMHLVRKTLKVPSTSSTDTGLMGRGNAVVRPTAKKQVSPELEASVAVDMNKDPGFDVTGKFPSKINKSKAKRVIRRLVRMFQSLTVIAALNVPIYIMLLFKDWIDR